MAQVVIRNTDDAVIGRFRARTQRNGISLEGGLRAILADAARLDRTGLANRAGAFRRKLTGRKHSDSSALIRQDRDRRWRG